MANTISVALLQHPADADADALVAEAAARGADVAVFPEMWSNGYVGFARGDAAGEAAWRAGAAPRDGDWVQRFAGLARRHRIHVVATYLEADTEGGNPFNAATLFDPSGTAVLHHRKVHICDFETPEVACARGGGFAVASIDTAAGPVTVGIMICMDREYADSAETLSNAGAEVTLVPNACWLGRDPVVGDVRIASARGRAFETCMGIAVANYPAVDPAPRFDGHSFAVDGRGRLLTVADDKPQIAMATFDLDDIRTVRREDHFRWQR